MDLVDKKKAAILQSLKEEQEGREGVTNEEVVPGKKDFSGKDILSSLSKQLLCLLLNA